MTHLTEREIQEYLDGAAQENRARVEEHVATCRGCHMTVAEYRFLYGGLADDSLFQAPRGLTKRVLARIEEKRDPRPLPIFEDALLLLGVVISAAIGVVWFVDFRPLFQSLCRVREATDLLVAPSVLCAAGAAVVITCLLNGLFLRRPRQQRL